MISEQQEILCAVAEASEKEFSHVILDTAEVIALLRRVEALKARVEEMRRRYEPTGEEQAADHEARLRSCWG